jgi:hypothetical protein
MAVPKRLGSGWHKENLRHRQAKLYGKAYPFSYKSLTFNQLKKKGIFLKYQSDTDKDGVTNIKDCRPLDKNKQDNGESRMNFFEKAKKTIEEYKQKQETARLQHEKDIADKKEQQEKEEVIKKAKELQNLKYERIKLEGREKILKLYHEEQEKLEKTKKKLEHLKKTEEAKAVENQQKQNKKKHELLKKIGHYALKELKYVAKPTRTKKSKRRKKKESSGGLFA